MRRIGAHVSTAGGLLNSIANIENIGGNCLQIFAGSPRFWNRTLYPESLANQFNLAKSEKDLSPVFIHALYLINLASDKLELLEKSINSLTIDLHNGDLINSAGVIVHIGSHQGRGFDSARDQMVTAIKQIINVTKETPFLLENSAGQQGKIGSLEELSVLVKDINHPRLGLCLDTAHLFGAGYDLTDTDSIVSKLNTLGLTDKVRLIHLNDSAAPVGSGRDLHADLGKGKIGLKNLSKFVNHPALKNMPLILETPGPDKAGPDKENINRAKSL